MVGTSRVCREGGTIVDSDTRQWVFTRSGAV